MGFYIRKSIKVGPLRFNLSKSGVGVSAGVKGFRVSMGPRGNYVHMGHGGLYYRAAIPASNSTRPNVISDTNPPIPDNTHDQLVEIESADVAQMVDSSSQELLNEISQKQKIPRIWPAVAAIGTLLWLVGISNDWPTWVQWLIVIVFGAGSYAASVRDALRKTIVVFYEFDNELEGAYKEFHDAAAHLASCAAVWHIEASGSVKDSKYHAGADNLVRRSKTSVRKSEPPYLKTNVETVSIGVGKQTLHFFPDRILVYSSNGVGAVGYKDLQISVGARRFIEERGSVPSDATVVDKTWKYVNKKGGPDKRFKDNIELPVCRYQEMSFTSASGLNELIQMSKDGVGEEFPRAVLKLASRLPKETLSSDMP